MIGERIRRLAFTMVLTTLLVSYSGCATYRDVALPASEVKAGDETPNDIVVEGDDVRLRLYSDETYSGKVIWITNEELRLGGLGNYGLSDITVQLAEIERIELRNESSGQIETSWFLGIGLGLFGLFYWSLSHSFGN